MQFDLSHDVLREILDYNPDSGHLFWKKRDRKYFESCKEWQRWNVRYAGRRAFTCKNSNGYFVGKIFHKLCYAHRIIWLLITGEQPKHIDHINGVRDDNKWKNLRSVTRSENQRNQKIREDNISGRIGVNCHKGRWRAYIRANDETKHLGYFDTFEAACEMRSVAERNYLYHENHGRAA